MQGSVLEVAAAGLFLLATHFGIAGSPLRAAMIARIGEGPYRGLFSIIALGAIVWLAVAFNRAPYDPVLWSLGLPGAIVPLILMPIALVLLIGGLTASNPTSAGMEKHLEDPEPAIGALRITRHPVQWAIALFAIGHIAANGELKSILLFGTIAALALVGTRLLDHRYRRDKGALYAPFELATSNLPFQAIVQGRQSLGRAIQEIGIVRAGAAVVLYGLVMHFHSWIFGVPALPL